MKVTSWISDRVRHLILHSGLVYLLIERKKIINQNALNQNVLNQTGRLPHLPQDLFLKISENLSWSGNVALELTCKQLAAKTY